MVRGMSVTSPAGARISPGEKKAQNNGMCWSDVSQSIGPIGHLASDEWTVKNIFGQVCNEMSDRVGDLN